MPNADVAPADAADARMRSMSGSLRKGMIGETLTPTGTPALASASIVFSRRCGAAARGSMMRARYGSSDVTDTNTCTSFFAAIGATRSRSRSMPADFVTIVNGWSHADSTSMMERVMRSLRSTG